MRQEPSRHLERSALARKRASATRRERGKAEEQISQRDLRDFLHPPEYRIERWRSLNRAVREIGKSGAAFTERDVGALLAELGPLEELCAYPGPSAMALLDRRLEAHDGWGLARLVQRISDALLSGSYRYELESWSVEEDGEARLPDVLPPSIGRGQTHRPYFETLFVSPAERTLWPDIRETFRRLRRAEDEFAYETVVVGSFEDALLAVVFNANLQAVVISDGFGYASRHGVPLLREMLLRQLRSAELPVGGDLGTLLAQVVRRWRPELDVYLTTDRDVVRLSASPEAAGIRRVFYGVEEPMEIHLAILAGVKDRYETPYFDNLKRYAQRPMGTFHALPLARGKSIFKSNWIRDMGEFYGANLFLAESSATTGGLDSLLEPTGNIKVAQDKAARALGGDRSFFVTNGTSTSNKIVLSALLRPGDIVLIDRDCHKSHHYGLVMTGAHPLYIDAFPLPQYSMYGSVGIKSLKKALLELKAEGKLDRVRMVVLTNCTFDGHVANVRRTMLECLAIKPDLIFLWDEAWFGFARFSPFLRRRTAMGAAATLREVLKDPGYRERFEAFREATAHLDPRDPRWLDLKLLPDPDRVRIRVYETDSVHKSMSALRQGSIIVVADQDFHTVEASFKEAFFTHTSTSPNLQIIASIDAARRQMELEGYELVGRALQLALEARRQINEHPLISKYFRAATPAEMIPSEYRRSGFVDWGRVGWTFSDTMSALETDEFYLDPTRLTLLSGRAGYDGTELKSILARDHDIQINKTSRNSILVQFNINNTKSDLAHLMKALADLSRQIELRLIEGGDESRAAFAARVRTLIEDVPDLPDFSGFHDAFRDKPESKTSEGRLREAYYLAYDPANVEHLQLRGEQIDHRLAEGPELVSARFVIPYPPGFPILVPGQLVTKQIVAFMRKLDVKEIHGYEATRGLELLRPDALERRRQPH
jgi:arginine decarboxylase